MNALICDICTCNGALVDINLWRHVRVIDNAPETRRSDDLDVCNICWDAMTAWRASDLIANPVAPNMGRMS